jgi:predicted ATPase
MAAGDSPSRLVRAAPFVGRAEEIASFDRWLTEAAAGQPRVALIEGDAGIGKTRVLAEVRSLAAHRGMRVCFGRCYEDLALPCLPFVESLGPHLERMPDDVRQALGPQFDFVEQVLRRVETTPSGARPSPAFQADHERLQLLLAVGRLIVELARRSPTLFVIDDLHWADRLSLDLFEHLAFTVAELAGRESVPLLIVGSYRPAPTTGRFARLTVRLAREEICRRLTLRGLDEAEIRELLGALGFRRPSHQLTVTMSDATQGNPLFI